MLFCCITFFRYFSRKIRCFSQEPNPGAFQRIRERLERFWFRALVHCERLPDRSRSRFLFSKRLRRLGTRHCGDIHNSVFSFALIFAAYNLPKVLFFEYLQQIIQQGLTTTRNSSLKRYVPSVKKISGFTQKLRKTGSRVVALQLCSPLQFGPLSYQPIEWGFISSNQSAL